MRRVFTALFVLIVFGFAAIPVFAQGTGKIFLVRHAEKEQASMTKDVPLSEVGRKRAACLATTLGDSNIRTVIATQFQRTQQTAAPLATAAKVKPQVITADKYDEIIAAAHAGAKNGNVLVVGHGDTVPVLLEKLGFPNISIPDNEFDLLFVVIDGTPGQLVEVHYCPAQNTPQ